MQVKAFSNETVNAVRDSVSRRLSKKRLAHVLRVEEEIARMSALLFPEREDEARIAALLHDVTKELSREEQISLCREQGILLTEQDLLVAETLHEKSAPAMILRDFSECATEDILCAVRYHATGRAGMSALEMAVFLADYIEPGRPYDGCREARARFWDRIETGDASSALEETVLYVLGRTLIHLIEKERYVDPETVEAYNFFVRRKNQ